MSTQERFSTVHHSELDEQSSLDDRPQAETYRAVRKRVKRLEVGFFVRKIVKGWLAYFKRVPAESRSDILIQALHARSPRGVSQRHEAPQASYQSYDSESSSPAIQPLSGHAVPPGDDGPIGETRVEVGAFAEVSSAL